MSKSQDRYDAIVIGSGQGGTPLSIALAEAGMRTALVERSHVGGTCINEGCTPTKTMVASGRVAYLARRAADFGVRTGPISVDMAKVRNRKRAIVDSFRNGSQARLEKTANLDLIFAEARFTGPASLELHMKDGGICFTSASKIFINAGTRPARPRIDGLDQVPYLDSTSIMELDSVPEHLLVLGGGYVGLEFGQLFRRFGSRVTIVQSSGQILPQEDADVAEAVTGILRQDGIEVLPNAKPTRVSPSGSQIQLELQTKEGAQSRVGTHILVATGRVPNADTLNLAAAAIAADDHGFIKVNDKLETTAEGVFALGDIKGGAAFTHISYDDFRILRDNLLNKKDASTKQRLVPYVVFIDPQLGRVGLTEKEARAQGKDILVARMPMTSVARALQMDETRGFVKVIIDAATSQILGAVVLGIEGGEVMTVIEVAMMGKLPYTSLRDGVFAHPTLSELLNNLLLNPKKQ